MRRTAIVSILITIIISFCSVYIVNACEPGEIFMKGSGKFIKGIRDYQHSISGDDYKDFEGEW